ncbi:MAG: hypothetical protein NC453_19430 [Muribaculum sp.]|nr:hypothetical protein [Muribaculum sp.]
MRNSTRVIVNTSAQYGRSIINLILSLYSTRLILDALGIDDYGIYTLVAGVVAMLSFMTSAMIVTTQRFMSYHQAKGDIEMQKVIFSNSIFLHLILGIIVLALLEVSSLFLFDGFLNIPVNRIFSAKIVYQCIIAMVMISFISSPFRAVLISHENIVFSSIIEVLDGVLKVIVALILAHMGTDKLTLYGLLMLCITFSDFIIYAIYDFRKYQECVIPKIRWFTARYMKSMGSFVGWQLYSTGCMIGRTQGTAIILNKLYGAAINASFGIAQQVNGGILFVASSILMAMNPQIVKAEGGGDRNRMFRLAEIASKFSFLLLALFVIPILFVLPQLLTAWLGRVPDYSILFCSVILITSLIDLITTGLISANQAIGNIGKYSLTVNTLKLLTLPVLIILLKYGVDIYYAIWCYAGIELVCAFCRLPFLKYNGGLKIRRFIRNVFCGFPVPICYLIAASKLLRLIDLSLMSYIVCCIPMAILYAIIVYNTSLQNDEKEVCVKVIDSLRNKMKI